MSVNCDAYVVYGYKITPEETDMDLGELAEELDSRDFDHVYDDMCGEYLVIGKTLASLRLDIPEDDEFIHVDTHCLQDHDVRQGFYSHFPECYALIAGKKPQLMVFRHWT